jgi:hypothetical protein
VPTAPFSIDYLERIISQQQGNLLTEGDRLRKVCDKIFWVWFLLFAHPHALEKEF